MLMKLRSVIAAALLLSVFAARGLLSAEMTDAEWEAAKAAARSRVRGVLYENDGDDCAVYPGNLTPSVQGFLDQRTSYLNKYPVSTIFYTATEAGFGHVTLDIPHADQLMTQARDFSATETRQNIYPYLKSIGTDTLTEQVRYAHANGIEIFSDIRMNDIHDAADRPDQPHFLFSAFKRNHPELLYATWDKPTPYGAWSSLDYGAPEVREYFIAHVTDIAQKYDVDGISFDFHRWPCLFRTVGQGQAATDGQRELITELFRKVRAVTEAAGRAHGRPQLIAIRIPDSIGYLHDMGVDLEQMLSEGLVDIVIPGGNFRLNPWSYSIELCRKYNVKCYPSIDMPQFMGEGAYRLARGVPMAYFARMAASFQAGAEGNYFFNLFSETAVRNFMRPTMADIRLESKRYHLTDRWLQRATNSLKTAAQYMNMPEVHSARPYHLEPGKPVDFPLEFGDDIADLKADGCNVKVNGIIKTNALRENAIRVTSNGIEWPFQRYDEQFLYYEVPDGALLPGMNTLALEVQNSANGAVGLVPIMSGKELLQGDKQPPWRRLWNRENVAASEVIVDGSYCLSDFGQGEANFFYPLLGFDANVTLEFEFKFGQSSDDMGAGVRIANGKNYEAVIFTENSVRLLCDGAKADFDTANGFHKYRIRFVGDKVFVEADGKRILEGALTVDVNDPRAEYEGAAYADGDMHLKGMVIGSMSMDGSSVSYWRNVRLRMPSGGAALMDMAVEVIIATPKPLTAVDAWGFQADGAGLLPAGNHIYSQDHFVGEAVFASRPANGTSLIFSNGGTQITGVFKGEWLEFTDGTTIKLPPAGEGFTVRGEKDGNSGVVAINGAAGASGLNVNHTFVSSDISSGAFKSFAEAAVTVIRRGGIALVAPDGSVSNAASALRGAWIIPVMPLPEYTPVLAYDSANGIPDGTIWSHSYVSDHISLHDGLLRLNNEHPSRRWQSVALADTGKLAACGEKVAFSSRFTMVKKGAGAEIEFYTIVYGRIIDGKLHEVILRIANDHIDTTFGRVNAFFEEGISNDVVVTFDLKSNQARLWLNGRLLLEGTSNPSTNRTEDAIAFGDGSGSCGGVVEVENFQIGPLNQ